MELSIEKKNFRLVEMRGPEAAHYIEEISKLRITVFHEYPYLYEGDFEYEKNYLRTYFQCKDSFVVLCYVGDEIVGASTSIPMKFEEKSFREPFEQVGYAASQIFYYGESVLLPQFRGNGIGQAFFDAREKYARAYPEIKYTCFCAVVRSATDTRKPANYRSLENFWKRNGYSQVKGLTTAYSWREVGENEEGLKPMQFWMKKL